jgi:hypothetical protein
MKRVLGFAILQASTDEFLVDFEEDFTGLGLFKWCSHPKNAKLFPIKKRHQVMSLIKQLVLEHGKVLTLVEIVDIGDQFKVIPYNEYSPQMELN